MEKHSINKLRGKEVINICDGKRLGFIHDALIDVCSGSVSAVSVLFDCRTFGIGKCEDILIPWEKISCFGRDAILVNVEPSLYEAFCAEKKFEKI